VNERRARELVARERTRVEALLAEQVGEIRADGSLQRQQTGEYEDAASELDSESVSVALAADLREQLAAVERAEERIARAPMAARSRAACRSRTSDSRPNPLPSGPSRSRGATRLTDPGGCAHDHREDRGHQQDARRSHSSSGCATPTGPFRAPTRTSADGWPRTRTAVISARSKAS
jgi:hypothetical protein